MADARSPSTIGEALKHARMVLERADIDGWDVEARLLSEWATGFDRLAFVTRGETELTLHALRTLQEALSKRVAGMPVHRIMGERAFYGLQLKLSADTLDPRPDTEALVNLVLEHVQASGLERSPLAVLDLGTGSGAIGLALAAHLPHARVTLTDISAGALRTALENAASNGLASRVDGLVSDWFAQISGRYDVIVSNPPYIRTKEITGLDREVREHDPLRALDGGADGLDPYRVIAGAGRDYLRQRGFIAVEFGHDQASQVNSIFSAQGWPDGILRQDLGGRDRALLFADRQA